MPDISNEFGEETLQLAEAGFNKVVETSSFEGGEENVTNYEEIKEIITKYINTIPPVNKLCGKN